MCGIAGYSLTRDSRVDRKLAAQALLAGIAERGADAVGYAWRGLGAPIVVEKQRSGASSLLERIEIGDEASEVLLHVRAYTKGHPDVAANNHPVRHGSVVGVHNGTIENDDAIFELLGCGRHSPQASVDSEAIFALADLTRGDPRALERLRGSMASAWLDEREPGVVHVARGSGRPVWLARSRREVFFASTRQALELLARTIRVGLFPGAVDEGALLALCRGRVAKRHRFAPHPRVTHDRLPAVRAPEEAGRCRRRLTLLATAATQR
jgi:glucosamine 6-phosphate synthetase-like amidotransferase/phosphosugar isomerase protein